jgi:hypothetical protein
MSNQQESGNSYKNEVIRRKLPNNSRTFNLYPLESFQDHPRAWLNWMKKKDYKVIDQNLKDAIKLYFKKIKEKCDMFH